MARFMGLNMAAERFPQEIKVADDIKDLVAHKFVFEPQFSVDDFIVS